MRGELSQVTTVHENKLVTVPFPEGGTPNLLDREPIEFIFTRIEVDLGNRSYTGVLPFLVAGRGKTQLGKARNRLPADLAEPGLPIFGNILFKSCEVGEVILPFP
jgi:hypothetical protein